MHHDYISYTVLGRRVEDMLFRMYAKDGRKRFSVEDIASSADSGYAPGRVDYPVERRDEINTCLEQMEMYGYIVLRKSPKEKSFTLYGGRFTEKMEEYCLWRGFLTKRHLRSQEVAALQKCRGIKNSRLMQWIDKESREGNYIKKSFPAVSTQAFPENAFINAVKIADEVLSIENGMVYERDVAKKAVNDSKGITPAVRVILERILTDCADEEMLETFAERKEALGGKAGILPLYGVIKTPEYIRAEGDMTVTFPNGKEFRTWGFPYLFSSKYLDDIRGIQAHCSRIITIENLTSYEDFQEENFLKIYTGGFLSFPARLLLRKIYNSNPDALYLHWSDIDCGGIRIFRQVKRYIPSAMPYRMDITTLEEYAGYGTRLTVNDRDFLCRCVDDPYFSDLAAYMLDNDIKLEQESFYA